jgi:predicted Rossmann fold flavoprotein
MIPLPSGLTAVTGGGAAGITAAIALARRGQAVVICERNSRPGRKILASGNGRCNLLHDDLSEKHYNPAAGNLVKSVFSRYGKPAILDFFSGLGLHVYSQNGRIFPVTNQSSSVLKVLELELARLKIPIEYNFYCTGIVPQEDSFSIVSSSGQSIVCSQVVLAGGGQTYPALGSDGSLYAISRQLGHSIVAPVPSAVPLVVKDNLCHLLQGQRISAGVKSIIDGREGREINGELLFTQYGLSGSCILDISREVSIALNRQRRSETFICVDLIPFMSRQQLKNELRQRRKSGLAAGDMLAGILPDKFGKALKSLFISDNIDAALDSLKARRFKVSATRGWNEAEFTSGGIDTREVDMGTLESKLVKGLYFAGEILDVDGERGGYNLGWAWASGLAAGNSLMEGASK